MKFCPQLNVQVIFEGHLSLEPYAYYFLDASFSNFIMFIQVNSDYNAGLSEEPILVLKSKSHAVYSYMNNNMSKSFAK